MGRVALRHPVHSVEDHSCAPVGGSNCRTGVSPVPKTGRVGSSVQDRQRLTRGLGFPSGVPILNTSQVRGVCPQESGRGDENSGGDSSERVYPENKLDQSTPSNTKRTRTATIELTGALGADPRTPGAKQCPSPDTEPRRGVTIIYNTIVENSRIHSKVTDTRGSPLSNHIGPTTVGMPPRP